MERRGKETRRKWGGTMKKEKEEKEKEGGGGNRGGKRRGTKEGYRREGADGRWRNRQRRRGGV